MTLYYQVTRVTRISVTAMSTWMNENKPKVLNLLGYLPKIQSFVISSDINLTQQTLGNLHFKKRLRSDCHACGSKTLSSHLPTPVFQFLTPARNVWAITASTNTFSPNSHILVGKVTGDEVLVLHVCVFMLDWTLHNVFRTPSEVFGTSSDISRYYQTATKNPGTLRIKIPHPYIKKSWQVYHSHQSLNMLKSSIVIDS